MSKPQPPLTPVAGPTWDAVLRAVADLTAAEREWLEERAAIREYDGDQPRPQAEAEALQDVLRAREVQRG